MAHHGLHTYLLPELRNSYLPPIICAKLNAGLEPSFVFLLEKRSSSTESSLRIVNIPWYVEGQMPFLLVESTTTEDLFFYCLLSVFKNTGTTILVSRSRLIPQLYHLLAVCSCVLPN